VFVVEADAQHIATSETFRTGSDGGRGWSKLGRRRLLVGPPPHDSAFHQKPCWSVRGPWTARCEPTDYSWVCI